jgi:hypothetical protein
MRGSKEGMSGLMPDESIQRQQGSGGLPLTQTIFDLPNPLVTRHLDPGLAGDPKSLAFGINLTEQIERKIDIHQLFGSILSGEVRRDVFPPFGTLCDLLNFNLLARRSVTQFLVHRLVSPELLSSMQ